MAGGVFILLGLGAVAAIGCVIAFVHTGARIAARWRVEPPRLAPLSLFGDFPNVPAEMRTGQPGNQLEPGGGVRDGASPSVTHNDIAHRGGAVTP